MNNEQITCPRCAKAAYSRRRKLEKELIELYGLLPYNEYSQLMSSYNFMDEIIKDHYYNTLIVRENSCEIEHDEIVIKYSAYCTSCQFRIDYKHKEPLNI